MAHWNGSSWEAVPSPNPATGPGVQSELVDVVALAPDDMWAVGGWDTGELNEGHHAITHVLIEHWDGSKWSIVPAPDPSPSEENRLFGVAAAGADDVWAVGFGTSGTQAVPLVEHWDGSSWSIVPNPEVTTPDSGAVLFDVAAVDPGDVWAVGDGSGGTLTEHWNGDRWEVVDSPSIGAFPDEMSSLVSVAALSPDDVWAVGSHISTGYPPSLSDTEETVLPGQPLVEHWDGTGWTIVDSAEVPDQSSYLTAVAAAGPNDLWAVGVYRPTGDVRDSVPSPLIEHWNGSKWSIVDSPDGETHAELIGVGALPSGEVWAVGNTDTSTDGPAPLIVRGGCAR